MEQDKLKQSFSLIELLIVITIIGVFSGLSLAYYNSFTEDKKIEMETHKIVDVMELAKKKANSADFGTLSCTSPFEGYRVRRTSATTYTLNLYCNSANVLVHTYTVDAIVTLDSFDVRFKPVTSGVIGSGSFHVKNSGGTKCFKITVNTAGLITIDKTCL